MNDSPTSRTALEGNRIFRSLRFRLAAWNAGTVLLTSLVLLIVLRQGVRWAVVMELDRILLEDVNEIVLGLEGADVPPLEALQDQLERKAIGHKEQGWYVKFLGENEVLVWASSGARPVTPKYEPARDMQPETSGVFRVVRHKLARPVQGISQVRVGASTNRIRNDLAKLDRWILIAGACASLAAPLAGYWLAGRAADTVDQITQAASQLRPSRLEERLSLRGTGDELDRLATTINGLLDRIAAYVNVKRDFLANAAHQLRTPLAAIRSSVEVALNGNRSTQEYEDLMVDLIDQCTTLETLVNQLLLIAETESQLPREQFSPVNLSELVDKAVEMFRGVAELKGIRLEKNACESAWILGNRVHLRQVLNNLLDNAFKYSGEGGAIDVTLAVDQDARTVVLAVQDDGIGIPQDEIARVFERFYRAEPVRHRAAGGTGLGLSICQSVVQSHGGKIDCESAPPRGTTIRVTLPMIAAPTDAAAPARLSLA